MSAETAQQKVQSSFKVYHVFLEDGMRSQQQGWFFSRSIRHLLSLKRQNDVRYGQKNIQGGRQGGRGGDRQTDGWRVQPKSTGRNKKGRHETRQEERRTASTLKTHRLPNPLQLGCEHSNSQQRTHDSTSMTDEEL